jgi:hypothetical protein
VRCRFVILCFCLWSLVRIANAQVYSIQAVGGKARGPVMALRVDDQRWFVKGFPDAIGIVEFRAAPDWKSKIEIYAGTRTFTLPKPIYAIWIVFALIVCAILFSGDRKDSRSSRRSLVTSAATIV